MHTNRLKHAWKVNDFVVTDFSGKPTKHKIIATKREEVCESGMMVQVSPPLSKDNSWIDANWFLPCEPQYTAEICWGSSTAGAEGCYRSYAGPREDQ